MTLTKKETFILISLIVFLIAINYSWLDSLVIGSFSDDEFVKVDKVIDGDTIKSNENSIRLLGINSPEKKEKYYQEAKDFLNEKILNKTVRLEYGKDKKDRYNRTLAYIFLNNENINLKQVEQGFANYYFPSGKDIYYDNFKEAWENCIKENKNLCEKSFDVCGKCILLKEFNYREQEAVFFNQCDYDCNLNNWKIKDEGRKNFIFPNFNLNSEKEVVVKVGENSDDENILFWKGEDYVWTETGDTLFLRDSEGKLVLWESY
ncbi:MAG: thermonuclease family protein [Candidatus Daviesbacteria bacterium]|nr:thermonuclease family protein [Candidatus Daviesbacteria bacterium]